MAGMDASPPPAPPTAPTARAKPARRLLLKNLTPQDWARVVAFLRLAQDRLRIDWELVAEGDAHVVLYGNEDAATLDGMVRPPLLCRHLVDRAREVGDLQRPLAYEALLGMLLEAEQMFAAPSPRASPLPAARPQTPPPAPPMLPPGEQYRLKRWPPAQMLQGNRQHMRVATFLSTRAMRLDELVFLSNVDEAICTKLLRQLLAAGLLDVTRADARPSPTAAKPDARRPGKGLLQRIRSAFGLGGGR